MTTFEIILSSVITLLASGNIIQFFMFRSVKKKADAEAMLLNDSVLLKRIDFLDERVTRLEKVACFDLDCKIRK